MLKKLKNLIKKLREILDLLFKNEKSQQAPSVEVEKPVTPTSPSEPISPAQPEEAAEPPVTNPTGQITSFLWKPVSDTNPKVVVMVVSCDQIRSDDLRVELYDKADKIMKWLKKSKTSPGRGNQLPQDKYGRINFKVGPTCEDFKKYSPVKVKFYVELNGVKTYVKVQNQEFVLMKKPCQRQVMKNGKLVLDSKV